MVSRACIIQASAFHLTTWLDAKVSEVPRAFAMRENGSAAGVALCGKGGGRCLETLLLTVTDQIFLMVYGPNDGVREKGGVVVGPLDH